METSSRMQSRRTYLRIPLAAVVELSLGTKENTEVFVRDLSVYGMGGYVNRAYQIGQSVLLRLKLKTSNKEVIEESIMAQVRWSKRLEGENNFAFGLIFHKMAERQTKLYHYLRDLEALAYVV